jgi:hypothetical protein
MAPATREHPGARHQEDELPMHTQPIGDPIADDSRLEGPILDLLVIEHDGLWSINELKQLMGDPIEVEDALARLQALGLIHKIEDCVFATRGTVHVHALAG